MNSKLELRSEAIRVAAHLEGVTSENLINIAKSIEGYIIGDAVLPDVMDMKEMVKAFTDLQVFKFKDYGQQETQELLSEIPKAAK